MSLARLNLSKKWARKYDKSIRIFVVYMEDITVTKYFRNLSDRGKILTTEESGYLNKFVERANKQVVIID